MSIIGENLTSPLPRPIHSGAEHERLNQILLQLDERLKHKDIWPVLGNKGVATEVMNARRSISKAQAKRLPEFFRVPIDLFI